VIKLGVKYQFLVSPQLSFAVRNITTALHPEDDCYSSAMKEDSSRITTKKENFILSTWKFNDSFASYEDC